VLCRGLERWLGARDTTRIAAILACDDDRIRLASSPDATAARRRHRPSAASRRASPGPVCDPVGESGTPA
jgi:hypothetical protein